MTNRKFIGKAFRVFAVTGILAMLGSVIGTAVENLELVAASIADIPGMDMTTDETGILAVRTEPKYENGAIQTVAYCGMAILPVFLDRIVKATASA